MQKNEGRDGVDGMDECDRMWQRRRARGVWGQPEQGLTMGGVTSAWRNTGVGNDRQDIAGILVEGGMRDVGAREAASLDEPGWTAWAWTAV